MSAKVEKIPYLYSLYLNAICVQWGIKWMHSKETQYESYFKLKNINLLT